jgi:hypothetical protein
MLMSKFAKTAGVLVVLMFTLAACNPLAFFSARPYDWQPTPTPRPMTATQVAELVQLRLAQVSNVPVTVEAVSPGELSIRLNRLGEQLSPQSVLAIGEAVGGFLDLNYTFLRTVTIVTGENQTAQLSAQQISAWYSGEMSSQEFVNLVLPGATLPEPTADPMYTPEQEEGVSPEGVMPEDAAPEDIQVTPDATTIPPTPLPNTDPLITQTEAQN